MLLTLANGASANDIRFFVYNAANGLADVQAMITSMAAQMRDTLHATRDMESAMTGYLRELEENGNTQCNCHNHSNHDQNFHQHLI